MTDWATEAIRSVADFVAQIGPGSWADWFAAIGTVGALATTAAIYAWDRRRARRALADDLNAWTESGLSREAGWHIVLHLENVGDRTIPDIYIRSHPHARMISQGVLSNGDEFGLRPGVRDSITLVYGASPPMLRGGKGSSPRVDDRLFLFFSDSRGTRWVRDVRRNRYVGRVRARLLKARMELRDERTRASATRRLRGTFGPTSPQQER